LRIKGVENAPRFADTRHFLWIGGRLVTISPRLRRGAVYLLPLAVLLVAAAARLGAPDVLERLSLVAFDLYQRTAPRAAADLPIRVVDIDDASLREFGQWPWPRTIVARLIDRLRDDGAAIIAFDIDFAEPDRTSPQLLMPLVASADAEKAKELLASLPDPDQTLAEAIASAPVVTGFILSDHARDQIPATKAGFAVAGDEPLIHVDRYAGAIPNLPGLEAAAAGNGFLNQYLDWDHVVRRVPLVLKIGNDKLFPSLAAEVLRLATGARTYLLRGAGSSAERSFGEKTGLTAMRIGQLTIPTDDAGRVWLHFSRPQVPDPRRVSAADVLDGKVDRARLDNNIVLIGTSAEGLINDQQATPVSRDVPGVEIHAELIEQILQGSFLVRPDWAIGAEVVFTVLIGIGLILAVPAIGALLSAVLATGAIAAAVGSSWYAFRETQLLIDPVYPVVVLTVIYIGASILGHLRTEARQREIRSAFSRYMSPHYVSVLARHPEKLVLGGEARQLTIMFCDIRGFTTLAEGLNAHALTMLMNSFTSPMTDIITEYRGTIDKYIGDCIMAFWNAPLDDPDHPQNAVRAAQAMRQRLVELNTQWRAEAAAKGEPFKPLRVGIGINTGECVVGNFGSTQRFNYSLLGDPVNLASRLEGLGKLYGVDLVIGEDAAMHLDNPELIELDLVAVKGKTEAVRVYTLPPEGTEKEHFVDFIEQHAAMLTAYRRQDWAAALHVLDNGELAPAEQLAPVYTLYRQRIAHFQTEPPPPDWDGVFTAETK
jgi:adenylate cyclase